MLAWLCLLSLASRSEEYPLLLQIGSAEIRMQDVLFAVLIAASVPLGVAWMRANRFIAITLGIFVVLVGIAGLRSPVGDPALVAVGKYLEFVLAGAAIALNIRRAGDPGIFTWAFVAATCLNLAVAVGQSLSHSGLDGPLTVRTGGLLGLESAAALAIVTLVWCLGRISRAAEAERRATMLGVVAALLLLLLAKSVLAAAALLALAVVSATVDWRAAFRAATFGTALVLVLIVTVGRNADVRSATIGTTAPIAAPDTGPTAPSARPVVPNTNPARPKANPATPTPKTNPATPDAGPVAPKTAPAERPPQVPPLYNIRQPPRVTGGSFVHRIALAYVGAKLALDSPLLGRGWQSTTSRDFLQEGPYDGYMVNRFPELDPQLFVSSLPNGPHNAYIQLIAEAGWAAAIALVVALLAALVGGFVAVRRSSTESWQTGVGAAWIALVAVFLMSSSLYGGQIESSFLGAAVVLGAPAASLAIVGARTWLAATALVLCAGAAGAALLFVPASDAQGNALARVRALTDGGRGQELFQRGAVAPGGEVVLNNGLLQAALGTRTLALWSHTRDPAGRTLISLDPGAPIARQVITQREADLVSIEGRNAGGQPIIKATLRRGVPIAYLWIAPGRSLRIPGQAALLRTSTFARARFPVNGPLETNALRGDVDAALVASEQATIAILSDEPVKHVSPEGLPPIREGQRLTVGILPRVHERPVAPGRYLRILPGRQLRTHIVREDAAAPRRAGLTVPFLLDDGLKSGLAEFIGFTRAFGRRLGDLP